ncbi:MAG: Atu4866 domain-containing protein [Kiloniellaceae bacterium]
MKMLRHRSLCDRSLLAVLVMTLAMLAALAAGGEAASQPVGPHALCQGKFAGDYDITDDRYLGMWATADGHVRHALLADGRYDEQRGSRRSAYQGCYRITGDHIDYVDDTGFTADGDFVDGVLHHGGMVLYRAAAE